MTKLAWCALGLTAGVVLDRVYRAQLAAHPGRPRVVHVDEHGDLVVSNGVARLVEERRMREARKGR